MGKKRSSKTEKPPAVDKLLKPVIGVVLAFVGYYVMKGMKSEIPRVDVTDELTLREIFFNEATTASAHGKNYAALCHAPPNDSGSISLPVSSVFQEAYDEGKSKAEFVLIDCNYVLPSGKSIAERFNLDLSKRPTVFVCGDKVGEPKQIPTKNLKTGAMLTKILRQMLEPHAAKIDTTKDLKSKCLNKPTCALLLKGNKPETYLKNAISDLLNQYPDVQFASIDSTVLLLSNLEEFMPEYRKGVHRFVVFRKVSGGLDASTNETEGSSRLITSIAPLEGYDGVSYSRMNELISSVTGNRVTMKKIPSLPSVKTRTKKLEEAERLKRQRKLEQQRRSQEKAQQQASGGGAGGGGTFQANDGSAEGRKAERERRREEHRKANNVREKTPEEIAEMERKRRLRMEEEAAKWNIAPEDAPPEGDPVDEGDYFEDWDDGDEDGGDSDNDGDGDEEDVLDLD